VTDSGSPERLRLLAAFIAGRSMDVATVPSGQPAHTDGHTIFVSLGASLDQQRRELVVQSALLGAGSLDPRLVKSLRGRSAVARRYLAIEGTRVLAELGEHLPLAAALRPDGPPCTATASKSLEMAKTRVRVDDPPPWFGVIRPSLLLTGPVARGGAAATDNDLRSALNAIDLPEEQDEDDDPAHRSKVLKLFETPVVNTAVVAKFLSRILGASRSDGDDAAGAEMQARSVRRPHSAGSHARPLPTQIRFTNDEKPDAALGVGGARHPEWDVFNDRYRPDWWRGLDFPLTVTANVSDADVVHDEVLRRRLSRIGLGPKALRARPDGDELDLEALIDLFADLRSGYSPPEHVYAERRMLARDLGVLILLDASGSATDTDPDGLAVHDHQRRAAATLAATLEDLGDRVAVYAFRSHGRHAVYLPAVKTFEQHFGALARARLNQLQPSGYTRLGAAIRGAGEILKVEAGTPNRLLVVISDGFPYDHGYEGKYAEADAHKALQELRTDGVACLCLSIAATTRSDALECVFGSACHADATSLAELSPRMDELFMSALRELAAPIPRRL
jgi:nitric oxide reductase activation protein